ncbi:hypothetical protein NIES4071_10640 [Calothrix sp. NIES-4071]|nr:hypothetical protein NIES4071_10640 [Calothrix sp. NIES-4071]BAZ55405.1 hypothetical protein NIES4105_10600 [Calothrix sp. NIES-4105]
MDNARIKILCYKLQLKLKVNISEYAKNRTLEYMLGSVPPPNLRTTNYER